MKMKMKTENGHGNISVDAAGWGEIRGIEMKR